MRLEQWSVVADDPFMAPEVVDRSLTGIVYDHPRFKDGTIVTTSRIVTSYGRVVVTRSGSEYELGEPHPDYVKWLQEQHIAIDPEQPVKVHRLFSSEKAEA